MASAQIGTQVQCRPKPNGFMLTQERLDGLRIIAGLLTPLGWVTVATSTARRSGNLGETPTMTVPFLELESCQPSRFYIIRRRIAVGRGTPPPPDGVSGTSRLLLETVSRD